MTPPLHQFTTKITAENVCFDRVYRSSSEKKTTFAIIHGGFWKKKYGVDTAGIGSLVPFLTR